MLDVAQVAGAVQAVQAGGGEFGEVADVVQPRGGLEQAGVRAEGGGEAAGPGGDALDVGPAAGKGVGQEGAGEVLSPGCECVCMKSTLVSRAGTFTDAACRLETSETSLLPRASHTGQSGVGRMTPPWRGDVLSLPRRQVEACPDDPAAAGGGLDAPAVRAGEGFDHVQAVRAAVGLPAVPGAAEVFGLDPDVIRRAARRGR